MNSTDYYRMRQLGLTKATANLKLLEAAFDPKEAYRRLTALVPIVRLLKAHGIRSTEDLEQRLQAIDNKKPPEGGKSETRAI